LVTEEFTHLIQEVTDLAALRRQSVLDGMKPLRMAGAYKVVEGVTTPEEVLKATSAR
jgi:general secretion pathway protein E